KVAAPPTGTWLARPMRVPAALGAVVEVAPAGAVVAAAAGAVVEVLPAPPLDPVGERAVVPAPPGLGAPPTARPSPAAAPAATAPITADAATAVPPRTRVRRSTASGPRCTMLPRSSTRNGQRRTSQGRPP